MKSKQNPAVNKFLSDAKSWQHEMQQLRSIILECPKGSIQMETTLLYF